MSAPRMPAIFRSDSRSLSGIGPGFSRASFLIPATNGSLEAAILLAAAASVSVIVRLPSQGPRCYLAYTFSLPFACIFDHASRLPARKR